MNTDIKAKWVAALRSGEYQQTTGRLHLVVSRPGGPKAGFCCLGVLCELAVKEGVVQARVDEDSDGEAGYLTRGARPAAVGGEFVEASLLPIEVQQWAGLQSDCGLAWDDGDGDQSLACLNDNGAPFAEIADVIEDRL